MAEPAGRSAPVAVVSSTSNALCVVITAGARSVFATGIKVETMNLSAVQWQAAPLLKMLYKHWLLDLELYVLGSNLKPALS